MNCSNGTEPIFPAPKMSITVSGQAESQTDVFPCAADWLRLRCWQSRLVLLLLLLGAAWLIDEQFYTWCRREDVRDALSSFKITAMRFGEPVGITFIFLAVWGLDRCRRRPLVFTIVTVLLAGVTASGLKLLVGRERPQVTEGLTVVKGPQWPGSGFPDPSFPSGHTAAAFALAYGLSRLYPSGRGVFLLFASACGLSRALSGKHFLTDVLAGAWLGWEVAGLVWNSGLWSALRDLLPEFSWYPRGD